jgi:quercetin dioxygenase-like cupin family protein
MTPDERRKRFFSGGAVVEGLTQIHGPCDFSMCWVELPAGAQFLSEGAHPGEELCHVIVGGVEVRLGDATYLLQPNDTLHFRPSAPHAIVNATNTPARLIWVSRPRAAL